MQINRGVILKLLELVIQENLVHFVLDNVDY